MGDGTRPVGALVLAALATALGLAYGATRAYSLAWQPPVDLGVTFASDSLRLEAVLPGGAAHRVGITRHDTLLAIDGQNVQTQLQVHDALRHRAPGQSLRVKVNLAGLNNPRTYTVLLDRGPAGPTSWSERVLGTCERLVPLLLLVAVGMFLIRHADRRECWLLLLVTAGAIASAPLLAFLEKIPPGARGLAVAFQIVAGAAAPAALHWLLATFPEASSLEQLEPRAKSAWLGGSVAVATPFALWGLSSSGVALHETSWAAAGRWISGAYWTAAIALGAYALWDCARCSRSLDARRRAALFGGIALAALAPAAVLAGISWSTGQRFADLPAALRILGTAPLLLLPFAAGHAVTAPHVLPLRTLVPRSLRALLVGRAAAIPIAALSTLVAVVLADVLHVVVGVVAGALLGFAAWCMHRRHAGALEGLLFPQQRETRRVLDALPAALVATTSTSELLALLERDLARAFDAPSVAVYTREGADCIKVRCGHVPSGMQRLRLDDSIKGVTAVPLAQLERGVRIGPDCAVPFLGGDNSVLGLVVLGARHSELPYSHEDLVTLLQIGRHVATALDRLDRAAPAAQTEPVEAACATVDA